MPRAKVTQRWPKNKHIFRKGGDTYLVTVKNQGTIKVEWVSSTYATLEEIRRHNEKNNGERKEEKIEGGDNESVTSESKN